MPEASVRAGLAGRGIDPGRLDVPARGSRREYLELYDRVDVQLDTFPYNGVTTTCDGLWMGCRQ